MSLKNKYSQLGRYSVMAIVNVTDDSFFAQSRTPSEETLRERVEQVLAEGADIIDIGGYSSRPGAKDISPEQEWERLKRGIQAVRERSKDVLISVDTFRAEVAQRALEEYGDLIINDISAGELSPRMVDVVADAKVPYIAMHMRGTPQTMSALCHYPGGVVNQVRDYFERRTEWLLSRGVEQIVLDPGFGFAKSVEQNFELLKGLHSLCELGYPVMAALSRKSMIYKTLGITAEESLEGTVALNWEALRQGARLLRVHDVKQAKQVVALYKKMEQID